jgi:ubiquinone/menaquinone biosynthesis C-methylase UbiE
VLLLANGDEVERLVEVRLARRPQREVACSYRRREPAVEGFREAQAWVDRIPAEFQRHRVRCQLARVEEAVHLNAPERRLTQLLVLRLPVLVHVPRVVRALRPLWRERQHVRRRHEHHSRLPHERLEMLQHGRRVLQMLDRLQEHHRVGLLGESLHEVALEAEVLAGVAQSRVLVRLGVRIHAHYRRRAAREHVRAIPLPAGHVDHALSPHPRRDPLVHRQMAAKPIVLLGHIRQRALTGERERRHALGLVALQEQWRRGRTLWGTGRRAGHEARVYGPWPGIASAGAISSRAVTPTLNAEEIRDVNTRYHDVAADHYDAKWGIDFGDVGQAQVLAKVRKAVGRDVPRFKRSLEIGSGTGYFTLNLMLAGVIGEATCTDISPGMLSTLSVNAERLGLDVTTVPTDAERLPFDDESFDLVIGHAILHHIPDLGQAFREFSRVLTPGGTVLFAGEPSRYGDQLAKVPKRAAGAVAPLWRRAIRARPAPPADGGAPEASLEGFVDVHAFAPGELSGFARDAGFDDIRVTGEELLANWFGWTNRTLEATAHPEDVPWGWRNYAYRGYLALQKVDRTLLESRLPAAMFYNLIVTARKP